MRHPSSRPAAGPALAAALAVLVAGVAGAQQEDVVPQAPESLEWSQERATALAGELVEAVKGLRESARNQPPPDIASMRSRAYFRAMDNLRLIESEARVLHRQLEAGRGKEETFPVHRRLMLLVRDTRREGRRLLPSETTQKKIINAEAVLAQLGAYYPQRAEDLEEPEGEAAPE